MAWEDVLRAREVREAAWRRENRRFNIIMGTAVGGLLLVGVVIGCAIVKGEPKVRAAYMARCEATGFNTQQCALLYEDRRRVDGDATAAIALGAAGIAIAGSRR
jgi:hypothetical protein